MNEDQREEDLLTDPWITSWEQQCIQQVENEPDPEERLHTERDTSVQKLWQMFQNSATSLAQLYKDRQQGVALWASFQTAAGAVTCMYKESLDIQKRSIELGTQHGYQRRTKDLLSWAKKHRRHIRREDLIAYLADKTPPPRTRGSPRQRLTLDRGSPRFGLSSQEPITSHTHNPEADMQTFKEALTLASLNGAMSNVSVGYRGHTPGSPPLGSHSRRRNAFTDLNAFICEEFTSHCEARKRSSSSTDVIMDSPTHKRSRLM